MRNIYMLAGIICGLVTLTGCSTLDPNSSRVVPYAAMVNTQQNRGNIPEVIPEGEKERKEPIRKAKLDVTPLTVYRDLDQGNSKVSFAGAYTRIVIRSEIHERDEKTADHKQADVGSNDATPMPYNKRHWFERSVVGRIYDMNLSAKLKIGAYEEVVPLVTLSSSSNSKGESWLRDVAHELSNFPWFLVKNGSGASVPRLTIEFNGSKGYESGAAGNALQLTLAAIKAVAPETGLITKLSSATAKDKAKALDGALSKLFSVELTERHTSDRQFSKWQPAGGLNVVVSIPTAEGDWNGTLASIGGWSIGFDNPRPSAFGDWAICKPLTDDLRCKTNFAEAAEQVRKEIVPSTVLNYPLVRTSAGDVTIKDHVLKQSWYATAISSFSGKPVDQWAANGLCIEIVNNMVELGLNSSDADLVVWAVINGIQSPQSLDRKTSWEAAEACKASVLKVSEAKAKAAEAKPKQ